MVAPWTGLLLILVAWVAAPAAAGSLERPDVSDDGVGEQGMPGALNVICGWVGNETQSAFSIFMQIELLNAPDNSSREYIYHFHFQVARADGTDALYHAMAHHTALGAWVFMTQRWLSSSGAGSWGETTPVEGAADTSTGVVEVRVPKSLVAAPRIDVQHNTWHMDHFYIHADEADASSRYLFQTDTAPSVGTMGAYDVAVGTPVAPGGSPGPGAGAAVAAVAGAAGFLLWKGRRPT